MTIKWTRALTRGSWTRMRAHVGRAWTGALAPVIRDRRGGLAPFLAISIIPLVAFIGVGTDAARGYIVKSRLSYALDAAGLAASHVTDPANTSTDLQMYFSANFPSGYMNAALDGPHFTMDSTGQVMTLSATATIPTTFTRVLGLDSMTVSASSEVTRESHMLEVMLSMDVSGSMSSSAGGGMTRIQAARSAATTLVNILYGGDETKALLQIGLVPWNSKVNVMTNGTSYSSGATTTEPITPFYNPLTGAAQSVVYKANNSEVPFLNAPSSSWAGCAYARYLNDGNSTDDADILLGQVSVGGKDWMGWQPIGPEGEPTSSWWSVCSSAVGGSECTPCYSKGITPLQDTKTAILNAISQLTNPTGNTNIVQGLFWAWQVLEPTPPFTEAKPAPAGSKLKQAIVLITDGEHMGGSGDAYKGVLGLGTAAQPWLDQRLRDLAANIKAMGVEIYAIQFGDITPTQEQLMKDIATEPNSPYYFYAPDSASLQAAFQEVANNLSQLRLSK
jgi:Flp pilus assembly protein TadG